MMLCRRLFLLGFIIALVVPQPAQARVKDFGEILEETIPVAVGMGVMTGVMTYGVLSLYSATKSKPEDKLTFKSKIITSAKVGLGTSLVSAALGIAAGFIDNANEREREESWRRYQEAERRYDEERRRQDQRNWRDNDFVREAQDRMRRGQDDAARRARELREEIRRAAQEQAEHIRRLREEVERTRRERERNNQQQSYNRSEFFQQSTAPDHYAVLGLRAGATLDEVTKAFRRLALTCHPDKFPGDQAKENQFKAINNAYEALKRHVGR